MNKNTQYETKASSFKDSNETGKTPLLTKYNRSLNSNQLKNICDKITHIDDNNDTNNKILKQPMQKLSSQSIQLNWLTPGGFLSTQLKQLSSSYGRNEYRCNYEIKEKLINTKTKLTFKKKINPIRLNKKSSENMINIMNNTTTEKKNVSILSIVSINNLFNF